MTLPAVLTPSPDPPPLRANVQNAYLTMRRSGWALAVACAQVVDGAAWRGWGFGSARAWAAADVPGIAANVSHYASAGRFLAALPDEEAAEWLRYPVWSVLAGRALLASDPPRLLAALAGGASQAAVRKLVAQAVPDLHVESEYRTVTLTVSEPVYRLWEQATNRARYEGCKAEPAPDDIVQCVAMAMINEPLYQPQNGINAADWHEAVHAGRVRCKKCGSYDRSRLTWHHTVARSAGGHASVQVPLCLECHEQVQPRWREWLKTWGLDDAGL